MGARERENEYRKKKKEAHKEHLTNKVDFGVLCFNEGLSNRMF